jgi:superfamily II DNA helicase RecQ
VIAKTNVQIIKSWFFRFITGLDNHRRLGPVVFDEIHKLITDSNYRKAFKNFQVLLRIKAVIFGLTGTLPPHLYPVLCNLTQMTWKVIRTPSWRKELKYQVVKVSQEKEMDGKILQHLQKVMPAYRPEDRAMVFCRSKRETQGLAGLLKVEPYHGHAEDDDETETKNQNTMTSWLSGENRVMVSTTILGCGLDYAHVRDVVHRGPGYSIIDQHQEDSRGGRDSLECRATTFIVENKNYNLPQTEYDLGSQKLNQSLQKPNICQRITASMFLDGRPIQCVTLPGAVFCQTCQEGLESSMPDRPPSPPRIDLTQKIRPRKKTQVIFSSSQTLSTSSPSPPSKRRKLSHRTLSDM